MTDSERQGTSGWVIFAATMMFISSLSNFATGMTFVFNSDWAQLNTDGDFALPIEVIGWINLGIGVLLIAGGIGMFSGATWARVVGGIAGAAMVINGVMTVPVYPGWGLVLVALGVLVIYSVTVKGSQVTPERDVPDPSGDLPWRAGRGSAFEQELPGEEAVAKEQELDNL